ncbi:MAG: hypothetical protein ACREJD_05005 [Phycisphaerales bacterium]
MNTYRLQLLHRETGTESIRTLDAESEHQAVVHASDDQHVVGRVVLLGPDGAPPAAAVASESQPTKSSVIDAIDPLRRPLKHLRVGGILLIVAGILVTFAGFVQSTAVRDMHNIGLLNQQLVTVITGCGLGVAGIVAFAIGEAAQVICNVIAGVQDLNR